MTTVNISSVPDSDPAVLSVMLGKPQSYTRAQYLARKCTHTEYFAQFVTPALTQAVVVAIGAKKLAAAKDKHLNDIPLHRWDALNDLIMAHCLRAVNAAEGRPEGPYCWSLSETVSIAKCAAHMWKEAQAPTKTLG